MNDELNVKVNSFGPNRALALVYIDPISGKKVAKSAKTRDWREAERLAGEWEKELRAGRGTSPSRITWEEFCQRCENEKLAALSKAANSTTRTAFRMVERILNPDRLCKLTPAAMSKFIASLRKEGMRDSTLGTNLRHLRAALSWAVDVGLLVAVPKFSIPKPGKSKGRPITAEEFDRMLSKVPVVRPDDPEVWARHLTGLWLSGLRLGESLAVSWDEDAPFAIDLTGRHPRFRISGEAQKSGKDELLPMTPDFAEFILKTPEDERHGLVFPLNGASTMGLYWVSRVIAKIGKKAGVIVATLEKRKKIDGKPVTAAVKKFASAHDLRRSFGTRWAKRVMPAILQRLMRHAAIQTTMTYYVGLDADEVADGLWDKWGEKAVDAPAPGNKSGNISPPPAPGHEESLA
jgi:integrase